MEHTVLYGGELENHWPGWGSMEWMAGPEAKRSECEATF